MSQTGTTCRAARGFLFLAALLGCTHDDTGTGTPEVEHIGQKDAESAKDDDASVSRACAEQAAAIGAFVAAHGDCTSDSDCVIVGDCSHADFQSVATTAADEARALVLGNTCATIDGPTYNAVCRANKCARVASGESCGQAAQSECPDGTKMQEPGCSSGVGEATFARGCYASCSDDAACAPGYSCQITTVHPCVPAPGENGACAACGAQAKLCLPAPDCEVELILTFGTDRTVKRVTAGGSTELKLSLQNRTDRALDLEYDAPCVRSSMLGGLSGYDAFDSCLAGRCPEDSVRERLTLAAGETRAVVAATLKSSVSSCNPAGLPEGRLAPSLRLPGLTGAKICGPAPVTLISGTP